MNCIQATTHYCVPVLSSYVCDHADSPRISANADLSTALKCLASGKKGTSVLELLLYYVSASSAYFLCIIVHVPRAHDIMSDPPPPPPPPPPLQVLSFVVVLGQAPYRSYVSASGFCACAKFFPKVIRL